MNQTSLHKIYIISMLSVLALVIIGSLILVRTKSMAPVQKGSEQFVQEGPTSAQMELYFVNGGVDNTGLQVLDLMIKQKTGTATKKIVGIDIDYSFPTADLELRGFTRGDAITNIMTDVPDGGTVRTQSYTTGKITMSFLASNATAALQQTGTTPLKLYTFKFFRKNTNETKLVAISPNNVISLEDSSANQVALANDFTLAGSTPALQYCNSYGKFDPNTCNNPLCPSGRSCTFKSLQNADPNTIKCLSKSAIDNIYDCCPAGMVLNDARTACVNPPGTNKPNLISHSVVVTPTQPKTTDTVSIKVTVKNIGDASANGFTYKLFVDPATVPPTNSTASTKTFTSATLNPGGTAEATHTFAANTLSVGEHKMYVLVDSTNTVMESDENNLFGPGTFTVSSLSCPGLSQTNCQARNDCFWDVSSCIPLTNIQGGTTCREQGGEPAKYSTRQTLAASLCAGSTNIDVVDLTKYSCQCGIGKCWNGSACITPVSKCELNGYCEAGETTANCAADCGGTTCSGVTSQTTCTGRTDCMWHANTCQIKGDYDRNGTVTIQDIVYILNKWGTEFTDAQIGPAIIIVLNTMQW